MKTSICALTLLIAAATILITATPLQAAEAPVLLGKAGDFVILSKSGITDVPTSSITGNIGTSPITGAAITGLECGEVTGTIYTVDAAGPACRVTSPSYLTTAVSDMEAAYTDAAGRPAGIAELGAGNIGGLTLAPGVYKWSSVVTIPTDVTLSGGSNDVWIFQIAGGLTQAAATNVNLIGGAQASNIFWQVAGVASMGATAHMEGVILSATGITLVTGASVNGRLLAQTSVTLQMNTITAPMIAIAAVPTVIDIGTLGGRNTYARYVNNHGQIIGSSSLPNSWRFDNFLWSEATGMVRLPAIGLPDSYSSVTGLNDSGLVMGSYTPGVLNAYGSPAQQAFTWTLSGGYRPLGTLGGSFSYPYHMNNAGQIAGVSVLADESTTRAFVWDAATGMRDLGSLGGNYAYPSAINASGQIIGTSINQNSGNSQNFFWDAALGMQPITIPNAGSGSYAYILSDSGTVWGTTYSPAGNGIFWWNPTTGGHVVTDPFTGSETMSSYLNIRGLTPSGRAVVSAYDLYTHFRDSDNGPRCLIVDPITGPVALVVPNGRPDGSNVELSSISKTGFAVGNFTTADTNENHLFIWDEVHGATDIGMPAGSHYIYAQGVNDRGEITGAYYDDNWTSHTFIWDAANGMRDFGTLGGHYAYPNAISNSGVLAQTALEDWSQHAIYIKIRP